MWFMLSDGSITDMAVYLNLFLILTGLTGIHSITTVNRMSVQAGDSITIPCLYSQQYRNHVKYLCKGMSWSSCSIVMDTHSHSTKYTISDDKTQTIFVVTIKDLTSEDTDHYWCVVEIDNGPDVGERFFLFVTTNKPRPYVTHQEFTGFEGELLTINCHSAPSQIKWCKLGSSCLMSSGSIDGTEVTIRRTSGVYVVTMGSLRTQSSGWYMCVQGGRQMPVHVTVTERPTTTTTLPLTSLGTSTTLSPILTHTVMNGQDRASFDLKSLIIIISLLSVSVMVALFIWFMIRKRKQTKAESSVTTTMAEEEVTYSNVEYMRKPSSKSEEEVTYCNIGYTSKASCQRSFAESDVFITYSSVVPIQKRTIKKVEAEDVTYSVLA